LEKENVLLKLSFLHNKFFCRGPFRFRALRVLESSFPVHQVLPWCEEPAALGGEEKRREEKRREGIQLL
jgi:hypothetical protein